MNGEPDIGDAAALDVAMDERRSEIRKRWNAVARDAGMTPQHLSRIRRGEVPLTDFAARGIDQALQWDAGTAAAYYRTGLPPEHRDRPAPGSEEWWDNLARALPEQDFWEVVEHAKKLRARLPKLLAERLAEYAERHLHTDSST